MKHFEKNSSHFFCPSTRKFFQESQANPRHSFGDFIHGYIYGRWPYLYISVAKGKHPLTKILGPLFNFVSHLFPTAQNHNSNSAAGYNSNNEFAEGYHGKVVPLEKASRLVAVNKPLNLPDLEQVIPYKRARDIILKNPDHIAVLNCPCRAAQEKSCQPEDVCLIIGEPFASFIIEHHPHKARWISKEEATAILEAEDQRGHVHHAFFKDAMLDRFYAICNCCSCCCGAISAHKGGTPMLASSGYVSIVEHDLCIGCETCSDFCQFDAIHVVEGQANVDYEKCMGCGVCINKCEQEAIALKRDSAKGEPLDIYALQNTDRNKKTEFSENFI